MKKIVLFIACFCLSISMYAGNNESGNYYHKVFSYDSKNLSNDLTILNQAEQIVNTGDETKIGDLKGTINTDLKNNWTLANELSSSPFKGHDAENLMYCCYLTVVLAGLGVIIWAMLEYAAS